MTSAAACLSRAAAILSVPPDKCAADWADDNFYLSSESSNTTGLWVTTPVQRAILNAMGSDAIEKVDFFKSARFGGTKMAVIANAYMTVQKRRNVGFYQPTQALSNTFVKNEIDPAIRDCAVWDSRLSSHSDKSPLNTLDRKAFQGCVSYYRGGSANNLKSLTLDVVILDELNGFPVDIGREGSATTLSWGRVKNSLFKKQIQLSTPTIKGFCLIEKASAAALDVMRFHVACPHCGALGPLEWGGKDVAHGFKWQGRDASTVLYYCASCGGGWDNGKLQAACAGGHWLGERGYQTYDGLRWTLQGVDAVPPRHVAFKAWSAYSPFTAWTQMVEEWYDAQGDIGKLQAFTNTTLGETWSIQHSGTLTAEAIDSFIPTDDLSKVIAVTAGIDTQDDRLEVQYVGHDQTGGVYVLGYDIYRGDMTTPQVFVDMARDLLAARFVCGTRDIAVINAAIDTQGHHTENVHKFLLGNKRGGVFIGINGTANATYEISDKPGTYKNVRDSAFYSIGSNVLKQKIFSAIRNFDADRGAFRIWSGARLPRDYSKQLTAEKMEIKRIDGRDKVVFTNANAARNEALDTLVYALAAKAYIRNHRGRQGRGMFSD